MKLETKVEEYKSRDDFNKDAAKRAKNGWRVVSSTERTQRRGCVRMIMFGFLFPGPKPTIVVTYERQTGDAP